MAEKGYKGPTFYDIFSAGEQVLRQEMTLQGLKEQPEVIDVLDSIGKFKSDYGQTISGLIKRAANINPKTGKNNLPDSITTDMVKQLYDLRTSLYDTTNPNNMYSKTMLRYKDISNNLTDAEIRANLEEAIRASYIEAGIHYDENELQTMFERDFNFSTIREDVVLTPEERLKRVQVMENPEDLGIPILDTPEISAIRIDNTRTGFLSNGKRREALSAAILKHLGFANYDKKDFGRITHVVIPSVLKKNPHKMERLFLPISPVFRTSVVIGNSIVCAICHRTLINWQVNGTVLEHRITYKDIVAQGLTGGNTYDNLFPAHTACNSIRSDRTFLTWSKSSNPKDLAINSDAFKLTSGIDESDFLAQGAEGVLNGIVEYAHYIQYRTMSAAEAAAKAIPYLARNDEEGNHIRQGKGHWTPLKGDGEMFTYDGSNIEEEVKKEVERVGKLQASGHRTTIIGQTTKAYDEILKSITGPLEKQASEILKAVNTIDSTTIILKDKATGKEVHKKIKVVHI